MKTVVIDAKAARRAALAFNLGSVIAAVFVPLLMLWIGASMFVYASMAHHPNEKVVAYNRWAGYRFYGVSGFLVIFGSPIYSIFNNWEGIMVLWGILFAVVVPAGVWAMIRAHKDEWSDTTVQLAPAAA